MEKFNRLSAIVVAPLDCSNVDTDVIIPKQFLKSIKRRGFGPNLFDAWRYLDRGELGMDNKKRPLNPEFVLNRERYRDAQILLARENFGCGSSREHAPWALLDYGFRVIIAPSFADIFYNNCFKNGLLPVVLNTGIVDILFQEVAATPDYRLSVDLKTQSITKPGGEVLKFEIDSFRSHCLLGGLDDIALTMQHVSAIKAYEAHHRKTEPWLFETI